MIVLQRQGELGRVETVQFSPDGATLLALARSGIHVWRSFTSVGDPAVLDPKIDYSTAKLQFTPDGRTLFTATNKGLLKIDIDSGAKEAASLWDGDRAFFDLARRGNRLIIGRQRYQGFDLVVCQMAVCSPNGAVIWERPIAQGWQIHPLFTSGDEEFIRLEREGGKPCFVAYATATGEMVRRSDPLAGYIEDWVVSPSNSVVACWFGPLIHVYPVFGRFSAPLASLQNNTPKEFTGIAFHPSGRYLAATSNDETVKLYDTTTWEVARTFTWDIGQMRSIAFSPDGTLAAAGSEKGKVVVWDVDL